MQGVDSTALTAGKIHSINLTKSRKKFCLRLHYNGANSYLFVNDTEMNKFKEKDSETVATPLRLVNISKDVFTGNMNKKELHGYVYSISVDYDAIAVDDILDIQNEKE